MCADQECIMRYVWHVIDWILLAFGKSAAWLLDFLLIVLSKSWVALTEIVIVIASSPLWAVLMPIMALAAIVCVYVLSQGIYFTDIREEHPWIAHIAGPLFIILSLTSLYGIYQLIY
jgi:hypothetical protein